MCDFVGISCLNIWSVCLCNLCVFSECIWRHLWMSWTYELWTYEDKLWTYEDLPNLLEFRLKYVPHGGRYVAVNPTGLEPVFNWNEHLHLTFAEWDKPPMGLTRVLWCWFWIANNQSLYYICTKCVFFNISWALFNYYLHGSNLLICCRDVWKPRRLSDVDIDHLSLWFNCCCHILCPLPIFTSLQLLTMLWIYYPRPGLC